jgi:putative hemolysin
MEFPSPWIEVFGIFALTLALIVLNGFFSGAEIAVVSLRRTRLGQLVDEGRRGAQRLQDLKNDSARFLATIQVGVTVLGSMTSVIGGASAVAIVEPVFRNLPVPHLDSLAGPLALGLTVLVISYLTLVLGELVPKSLALHYTEGLACFSAPVIYRTSQVLSPAIRVLQGSTRALLRAFGRDQAPAEVLFSEEEVKRIVREGTAQGIFDEAEHQLIRSVFEFTDTSVREVMVPRADMHAVDLHTPVEDVMRGLLESGFSRAPVYNQDLDHVVGVVHIKDLLRHSQKDPHAPLSASMRPALFVPDSMQISDLLRDIQTKRAQMAIVLNEFGTVIGLATIEDLLEEIVGEIRDEFDIDEELPVHQLPDGSLLVDGSVLLEDLKENYGLPLEETPDYRTIAGFVLARLRRIPKGGEAFKYEGLRMTIVTVDDRRLRKVRIERGDAHADNKPQ